MTLAPLDFVVSLALISVAAGVLGSLIGLGGGVVIVPVLTLLYHVNIRLAIGASIVSVIATSSGAAAEYVRERMTSGEFTEHFPTDEELTSSYKVSRQTVREAVRRLTPEELVVGERGRGSSVTSPIIEQTQAQPAAPDLAVQFGLEPGAEVIYIERLRFAAAEPIAWDRSWLPAGQARALLNADLSAGGLYELLALHCSVLVTGGWERIRPVVPDGSERRMLKLPARTAVFSIERMALLGDRPIEWRNSLIRGDRYSLIAQWPTGTRPVPESGP